jgi:hypothetical protein
MLNKQRSLALLAVAGALLCATCSAIAVDYPASIGPHSANLICYARTTPCYDIVGCQSYPISGQGPEIFTCGEVLYNANERTDWRSWGLCDGPTVTSCTYYDEYYCAEIKIYSHRDYSGNCVDFKCRIWVVCLGCCEA